MLFAKDVDVTTDSPDILCAHVVQMRRALQQLSGAFAHQRELQATGRME